MAASAATPSAGVTVSASGATPAAAEVTSPTHVSKKCKTFAVPTLTAFEAMQAAYALPLCITGGVQGQGVTPTSLASAGVTSPAVVVTDLSELILKASSTAAVSCAMPSSLPTATMTMTNSPISTPLPSSIAPSSLFDSPVSVFSATEKEMPTVSAAHEATSVGVAAVSNAGGSSSGIANDGACLVDDLYLPTINWDPHM
ncbi:hypothetical protein HanXRQr2_Chr11g0508001 [Helianthus annuus]|uniref:Uncharacterized protein n=1 Tax=Helianthus annuus TaxID=4232 RepID=A0A9K3N1C2_HELAN|nr:hypothetical protein HanXRQr2_Chr11g0508001 [Helianthus annuus]KAJ0502762.1 hypothetical protein HanHA300_Chr11g0416611 [Helianthus annuus]KAJ0518722.1 hypothetical protein HanHA89_Chr11g0440641 [Helianthus annuus]